MKGLLKKLAAGATLALMTLTVFAANPPPCPTCAMDGGVGFGPPAAPPTVSPLAGCVGGTFTASVGSTVTPSLIVPCNSSTPTTGPSPNVSYGWILYEYGRWPVADAQGSGLSSPSKTFSNWSYGPGEFFVVFTASYQNQSPCTVASTSYSDPTPTFKVVAVASISSSLGQPTCESGDMKTWVTCVGAGTITVTATPTPSLSEAELPGCWNLDGGQGTGKLTRTVNGNQPGTYTITATAGSSQKIAKVVVVSASISDVTPRIPIYGGGSPISGSATITLDPSPLPCGTVTVSLSTTSGSGSATFSDGTTTKAISQTTTLSIRGTANSSVKDNIRIAACNGSAQFSVRTWPLNWREVNFQEFEGLMTFTYDWDSESGNKDDITATGGEYTTYVGNFPMPPYGGQQPSNPMTDEISLAGTGLQYQDDHLWPGFPDWYKPFATHNPITATQIYRFRDSLYDPNTWHTLMGPHSIVRRIDLENGKYIYKATKTGKSSQTELF